MADQPLQVDSRNVIIAFFSRAGGDRGAGREGGLVVRVQHAQERPAGMRGRHRVAAVVMSAAMAVGSFVGLELAASTPPAGAASGTPVAVGDLCSCTGPEASTISQTTDSMKAWASWVNAHGGLAGHPVQLIVRDDNYNPGQALTAAQTFINQDHVVAIFDNSDETPAWANIAQQANVPVLGASDFPEGHTNTDFYPPGGTDNYAILAYAVVMKKAGLTKVAGLYCVEVAVCATGTQTQARVSARYGVKYVYQSGIGFAAPSYTAECLAAKQAGAQAMTVGDATAIVTKVAQDCATQGYKPVQISSDGIVANVWLTVPAFNGNIDIQANVPWFVRNAATNPMYAALNQYAPQVPKGPNFGEVVVQAWAAGVLLQEAVKAAPPPKGASVTAAGVKNGLYSLPAGETLGGLSPSVIHFTRGQPANFNCFAEMGIKNGRFVQLNGGKPLCTPLQKPGWTP